MHYSIKIPAISLLALLIAGCATPAINSKLKEAHERFSTLQSNPLSNTMAPLETKDAFQALNKADAASNADRLDPAVDQLAYLANQKIAFAEQTILGRKAQADLQNISVETTQVQLEVRTQQLKALQAMNAKQTERGQVITFSDVLFDTGKAELKYGSRRNFEQLANFLIANPERKLRVEGFTDNVGSDEFNQRLSERRAASVAAALSQLGVDPGRILTQGYGEEYPIADNNSVGGRQLNRRVEVIVSNGASLVNDRY
ncbi:OmpA family protein [Pseudomonas protegens]|uniref:OmpA family protein n=1 Tax=Pseudomonas protegens TaxID=380021 RepID=UPI00227FBE3F|nr:OmpA family protein [Pseudomonas protegens]MCY7261881.1 OmpA family protein [Pseudomonas protegens]